MSSRNVSLIFGEGVVTVQRGSIMVTANILGDETATDSGQSVWLDRLVHTGHHESIGKWVASGALVTQLTSVITDAQ